MWIDSKKGISGLGEHSNHFKWKEKLKWILRSTNIKFQIYRVFKCLSIQDGDRWSLSVYSHSKGKGERFLASITLYLHTLFHKFYHSANVVDGEWLPIIFWVRLRYSIYVLFLRFSLLRFYHVDFFYEMEVYFLIK